jgi:hypothetical protein
MMVFAIGMEHSHDVPVQRPHDADARQLTTVVNRLKQR